MSSRYHAHKATAKLSSALLELLARRASLSFKVLHQELSGILGHPIDKVKLRNRIAYYQKTNCIAGSSKEGFQLTKEGLNRLQQLELVRPDLTNTKWDGKWRLIAFDIPEDNRPARDAIRRLIKQLGCHQLQRSLWVHPLPCLKQFRKIQQAYDVADHIILIETNKIDCQEKLIKQFRKYIPNL